MMEKSDIREMRGEIADPFCIYLDNVFEYATKHQYT